MKCLVFLCSYVYCVSHVKDNFPLSCEVFLILKLTRTPKNMTQINEWRLMFVRLSETRASLVGKCWGLKGSNKNRFFNWSTKTFVTLSNLSVWSGLIFMAGNYLYDGTLKGHSLGYFRSTIPKIQTMLSPQVTVIHMHQSHPKLQHHANLWPS